MTTSDDDKDYKVGYGKPPKEHQFKKGQSGNPKGRPKGSKNVATVFCNRFFNPVAISENGRRKQVPAIDALALRMIKSALEGDGRSQDRVIKLLPIVEAELERESENRSETQGNASANDRAVLETLASMLGGDLDDLGALTGEDPSDE